MRFIFIGNFPLGRHFISVEAGTAVRQSFLSKYYRHNDVPMRSALRKLIFHAILLFVVNMCWYSVYLFIDTVRFFFYEYFIYIFPLLPILFHPFHGNSIRLMRRKATKVAIWHYHSAAAIEVKLHLSRISCIRNPSAEPKGMKFILIGQINHI